MNLFQDAIVPRHVALFISALDLFFFFRLDRRVLGTQPYWLQLVRRNCLGRTDGKFRGLEAARRSVAFIRKLPKSGRNRFVLDARIVLFAREICILVSNNPDWKSITRTKPVCMVFSGCQTADPHWQHPHRFLFIFVAGSGRQLASKKDIGVPSLARMFGLRVDDPNFFFVEDN